MKSWQLFFAYVSGLSTVNAQVADWSTVVAPIIYQNCSGCHHTGNIAPFPLMSYADAYNEAAAIQQAVNDREMPPWPADPAYRHFAYEAVLDSQEIADINEWVNNGMPLGDTALSPPVPVFNMTGSLLDTIHYTVQIPPYTLQYNTDEYRYFAMHTGFTDTVYVSGIEVIPGLPQVVHHADIHYDLSGSSFLADSLSPLPGFSSGLISNYYMNAWQPGGNIAAYPPDWGIMVPPGADFVLEIHYGPGSQGLTDTTKMNLRFITNPVNVRPVHVGWLLNNPIPSQGPLFIPPDTVITFNQQSAPMPGARSLISICPHMHKLGKSYKVWFTSAGDSVPLIDIPQWDFHWQKYYMFEKIQVIPAGAVLHSIASYDNTVNNPDNPNNPPIAVSYGPTTNDEMLMTYFIFAGYEPGDENIVLDSTWVAGSISENIPDNGHPYMIYPNPSSGTVTIEGTRTTVNGTILEITDGLGRVLIKRPVDSKGKGLYEQLDVSYFSPGMYLYRITEPGMKTCSDRFIVTGR